MKYSERGRETHSANARIGFKELLPWIAIAAALIAFITLLMVFVTSQSPAYKSQALRLENGKQAEFVKNSGAKANHAKMVCLSGQAAVPITTFVHVKH